jgi:hypothetical protein
VSAFEKAEAGIGVGIHIYLMMNALRAR